jgi:hypothetical protein
MAHKARGLILLTPGRAIHCCTRVNTYGKGKKFTKLFRTILLEVVTELLDYYWISVDLCIPQDGHYHFIPTALDRLPTEAEVIARFNTRFDGAHPHLTPTDLRLPEVRADMVTLSSFMRDLNSFVARRCNAKLGYWGRLWRDRYHHTELTSAEQLLQSAVHAELSLVRAQEVVRPQDSPYSCLTRWLVEQDHETTPDLYRIICHHRGVTMADYPVAAFCEELCLLLDQRLPGWQDHARIPHLANFVVPPGQPHWMVPEPRDASPPLMASTDTDCFCHPTRCSR